MFFKENLRYLRKKNHLSQVDMARMLDYKSFTTIQKWEDGSATPKYDVLIRIADHFNVSIDDLLRKELKEKQI